MEPQRNTYGHSILRLYICTVQKFLVIQTAFIGDVVLATAIIEKLHAHFPDARIDFLVRKGNEALLKDHPFLYGVLVWDKRQGKLKNLWTMGRRIRREHYDKVINVQRFAATGLLTAFSGAGETIGFDKNPLSRLFTKSVPHVLSAPARSLSSSGTSAAPMHEIDRNQQLIKDLTDDYPARPRLYPSPADYDKVRPYQIRQPYITVSPASVWFTKQYPKEKWAAFINKLPPPYTVYLLGAPSDHELCGDIVTATPGKKVTDLSGQLSFLQSAALMTGAVMNYVNDSAPMHFASAVNAPVTAIYCSTIPAFGFGPLPDRKFIVEVREPLDCRPCGLHGYKACPRGHFHCAWHIADEQLLATLP
jgi:ADP-heptose:LPS heptosyltransferase